MKPFRKGLIVPGILIMGAAAVLVGQAAAQTDGEGAYPLCSKDSTVAYMSFWPRDPASYKVPDTPELAIQEFVSAQETAPEAPAEISAVQTTEDGEGTYISGADTYTVVRNGDGFFVESAIVCHEGVSK